MVGIYKITSPSGKVYIGQSVDLERRKCEYLSPSNSKSQRKLHNSIVKYGFSTHIFEIVEECAIKELNTRERHWQDFYNVLEEGLNCRLTTTLDRSGKVSKETDRKRSEKKKKPVLQYSLQGILIKEWSSIKEAGQALGIQTGNIPACCKEKKFSVGKFIWRYKANTVEQTIEVGNKTQTSSKVGRMWSGRSKKPVLQYTKEGTFVKEWKSVVEAAKNSAIRETGIINCCKYRIKTSGGFIWIYK